MTNVFTIIIALLTGIFYFILPKIYLVLIGLLIIGLLTRFNNKTKNFGKFVEILFIFYLILTIISNLGVNYPESLIIIFTVFIVVVFLEGPGWRELFFQSEGIRNHFKVAVIFATAAVIFYLFFIYFNKAKIQNPIPVQWPVDALIIVGIGFSVYLAIIEEIIFCSIIFERVTKVVQPALAISVQAILFGMMQYRYGVPAKTEGLILGTLLGLGLGYLVYKSKSIYLVIMVRFILTLGIFGELILLR